MRLISYRDVVRGVRVAFERDGAYYDVGDTVSSLPTDMVSLIAENLWTQLRDVTSLPEPLNRATISLCPPVPRPSKIICVGLNYADHARETGKPIPTEPVIFSKFPSALIPHNATIKLSTVSQRVDYEAELVVVIGRRGRDIPEADAMTFVAGYCCGNDVSARDWQFGKPAGQWLLGKTFDTFAPVGPELVTADEIADPGKLRIALTLNGVTMQESSTAEFIFGVPQIIAYISQVVTLEVGDLIFTGTPAGVGDARTPPVYLASGDTVAVTIESVGRLENKVM